MTDLDAALVRRKLAVIKRNLDDLAEIEGLSLADYRSDRFRQKGTERLMQETVEAALAEHLAPAAGLRNRLVHEYEEIDDEKVLEAIADARREFAPYVAALEFYLSGQGL